MTLLAGILSLPGFMSARRAKVWIFRRRPLGKISWLRFHKITSGAWAILVRRRDKTRWLATFEHFLRDHGIGAPEMFLRLNKKKLHMINLCVTV